ncbi:K+ transporter, Kef-type [Ectocarpus siliculosus]|uniref:K+ transporter, Kef-type n=1 Tax=Ectocarpus siliculosus TaxID=2880 RepID=D8LKX7_ECTSI|nr:K+ transporter, Kef-type [Ectocarpus siliculosus]|eukprot:CBN80110.1 K+ transporter, Kef-type [Ectocarpus siliculosus]
MVLALWEGGMSPFPLHPAVAATEVFFSLCYAAHIFLNLWTFGVKQYRDKRWHFTFTVLAAAHLVLMCLAFLASKRSRTSVEPPPPAPASGTATAAGGLYEDGEDWWNCSRFALLGAQALRPMMLISNLKTIRRVFTNVLRTAKRTGSILVLGAVVLAFYSVLGINLFNSKQVKGYTDDGDNFNNFGSSLLSLFVLVTEENFPMVADPSFTQRPLVAFPFFVSFLLLVLVVILPLLLGIVLDAYAQQHARQHERYRRKARNALLAAYFVLDGDGVEGLSRDQLVGVLTVEAGVGIDREQVAESGEGGDGAEGGRTCFIAGYGDELFGSAHGGQRWDGGEGTHGAGSLGDGKYSFREDEEDLEGGGGQEQERQKVCWCPRDKRGNSDSTNNSERRRADSEGCSGDGDSVAFCPQRRLKRLAHRMEEQARAAARDMVGREWFSLMSKGIGVLLAMLAVTWTPRSQLRYDKCPLGEGEEVCNKPHESEVAFLREDLFRRLEGLVLLAFSFEMAAKVLAVGGRRLLRLHWAHRFDLIILATCLASYLFVGMPGNRRALYVDHHPLLSDVIELPMALAVLRLVTVFPQLRKLLETMSTVAGMLMKIMVLYSCVSYTFATLGMAIFSNARSDLLEPRYSFSTLPEAAMTLFFLTVSNNWNDLLYPLVDSNPLGRWSAIYFVAYMLFCATMMLDVLTGVVIEGFRVSTKGPEQAQELGLRLASTASAGAGDATGRPTLARSDDGDSGGDGGASSGNSVGDDEDDTHGGVGVLGGGQRQQQQRRGHRTGARRGQLTRKASQRKYTQVRAEDMFRSEGKVIKMNIR